MRSPLSAALLALSAAGALTGCVVAPRPAPPPRVVAVPPGPPPAAAYNCYEERREAQVAQRYANRERQEAAWTGAPRQADQAWAAQRVANQQRAQAARAC